MFKLFNQNSKVIVDENETIYGAKENIDYIESFNFSRNLKKITKKLKNKTVLIYGAGVFFEVMRKYYDFSGLNIIGISDRKFAEHEENQECFGYKVYAPSEIKALNPDYVLVATKMYVNIIESMYEDTLKGTKIKVKPLLKKDFWTLFKEIWDLYQF